MAKRRHGAKDEILLVPFLDILCSLIGVLVLIIVVLCVSMTEQTDGRPEAEVEMAQEAKKLRKEIDSHKKIEVIVNEKIATLDELQKQIEDRQQRYIKLRKLQSTSKEILETNQKLSQQMLKELDDLLLELDGLKKQQVESKAEITKLLTELKKRQVPEDKKVPPVIVQPSGSGMAEDTKVFFVEAAGGALKILGAWGTEDYRLPANAETIIGDVTYNHFLTEVAKLPKALVLFLVRDDGQGAFNNGAGRADNDYKVRIGKLPIPGRGTLDLKTFDKYRGKITPPQAEALKATPIPAPPKADAKNKAAETKKAETPK
jgi:biopolymer transport protein ExbD